eukprot:12005438-Prorocentrum_lima.AAC.1
MTSSLVGSEMCIRDRVCMFTLRRHETTPLHIAATQLLRGEVVGVEGAVPVSYTHLTLPTICSV